MTGEFTLCYHVTYYSYVIIIIQTLKKEKKIRSRKIDKNEIK